MLCLAGRETLARAGLKQKLHLRNVARKASSVQALARWGLWLIHAFNESNDEVRRAGFSPNSSAAASPRLSSLHLFRFLSKPILGKVFKLRLGIRVVIWTLPFDTLFVNRETAMLYVAYS